MGILRKIRKSGKVVLSRDEYRIGNFIVCVTDDRISFRDINDMVSHSVAVMTPRGQMLSTLMEEWQNGNENAEKMLVYYVSTMFNVLSSLPFCGSESPLGYLNELNEVTLRYINENRELYGLKGDISPEEDGEILDEVKNDFKEING